ncbi:DUF3073 domain-containing protein [Thermostaphylospora chromogena]|uniref:DUF3073 domain-containing protein n=1 Tax=Thermostaphylospora chromogena TaxID=35622 RepID=A0A1H1HQ11_9ACTN|nr:DUF3073 domain-containing protein [Thermostaphylospora chromogena]SDR27551.1 Protein of unknown function [Thermostaphylospora chromogena]
MGRGRAKAKQTKVARELKYASPELDLERLREELAAANNSRGHAAADSHADKQSDR